MKKQILILIILTLFISCAGIKSPPQGTKKKSDISDNTKKQTASHQTTKSESFKKNTSPDRFADTSIITYKIDLGSQPSIDLENEFEETFKEFDKNDYYKSCDKFKIYSETFDEHDSLRYESLFLLSECMILSEKIQDATLILENLLEDNNVPDGIIEKVLVRLGQLYCVQSRNEEAEKLFDRLKNNYPSSIYIPLANCESVKK